MSCGEFIILGSTKLKENALVLHTISAEWGRRGFVVNVSRKTSGALYQILSIIDGEVVPNPRSELYRLRGVGTAYPLTSLRTDMRKSAITMFLGEVLYRTLTEGMVDSALFEWCKVSEAISRLEGINCKGRGTSCPDQLAKALKLLI